MKKELERLVDYTSGCREDMHEPDEQGLAADVIGQRLDNAMGNRILEVAITDGFQEIVVILRKEGKRPLAINLATLIALARKATI